ncbi:hypothetical protein Psi02_23470 [Planotetraspora silvatica]|uniref:Uncharacterized protein n=1 Tax=Planotetraspora silvatica TaxID=234614 RepID=A0A8J3UII0_9ACTN|nr:hypothetical protein Psi02_23470 [Planotetraspora silvatica]
MIGKANVKTTASFSRKNIFVSAAARARLTVTMDGIGAEVTAAGGAWVVSTASAMGDLGGVVRDESVRRPSRQPMGGVRVRRARSGGGRCPRARDG